MRSSNHGERPPSVARAIQFKCRCAAISRAVPCFVKSLSAAESALPLLYAAKKFDGVLFERNSSEKSVLGQMIQQLSSCCSASACMLYTLLYTLIHSMCSQETCSISRKTRRSTAPNRKITVRSHSSPRRGPAKLHSQDRAKDPKTPQVDGGDGAGGSPEDEEDVEDRPGASESSSDEADGESRQ